MPRLSRTVGKLTMWSSSATQLHAIQCHRQAASDDASITRSAGGRVKEKDRSHGDHDADAEAMLD
jgi:hypothetical protein